MTRRIFIGMAIGMLLLSLVAVFAASDSENPNDPAVNPNANACYTGGSMAGKCKADKQLWIAGWYAIRYQRGLITADQIPDPYKWLLDTTGDENQNVPETTPDPVR